MSSTSRQPQVQHRISRPRRARSFCTYSRSGSSTQASHPDDEEMSSGDKDEDTSSDYEDEDVSGFDDMSDDEEPRGHRPDVAVRREQDDITDCVAAKTTLNSLCKRGGRPLPGRDLPWEEVLADYNKGIMEAYVLANVHILRLLGEHEEIPVLDVTFFKRCISAVMRLLKRTAIEPELQDSRNIYTASRARSPLAFGGHIVSGLCHNAAVEMAAATKTALSQNFYRRFNKFIQRTYLVDSQRSYWLLRRILSPGPYEPTGTHFDFVIDDWRVRIPRNEDGYVSDEPHRLVPLTYLFLKDIEERNEVGRREDPDYKALRVFSILPTKRGFQCSHMKVCETGLHSMLKRAGYNVPPHNTDAWRQTREELWRRLFNIDKFETATRTFAGFIVTDGKAASVMLRKPKCEPTPERQWSESDFTLTWGLDPGRHDMFVATNQLGETEKCSSKEFYEDARYTKKGRLFFGSPTGLASLSVT